MESIFLIARKEMFMCAIFIFGYPNVLRIVVGNMEGKTDGNTRQRDTAKRSQEMQTVHRKIKQGQTEKQQKIGKC